jgi:hypothetical protein
MTNADIKNLIRQEARDILLPRLMTGVVDVADLAG